MPQTAQLVHELAAGVVDSTGAIVASGLARFYQPNTTTPIVVYSDAQGSTPLSQPVTLSAGGTATVYTLVPARMILEKSDDATVVLDVNVNTQLAGAVYIKNPNVNSGAETTLDALLSDSSSNFAGYLESSGATLRSYQSRLQDQEVSVKDFAAVGDGVTDDTVAIQAALDHCGATGKDLLFPAGTYLISSALALASYTKKFNIRGTGAKSTLIKQNSTSANGMTVSYGVSTDWGAEIRAIGFTCTTTSSGAAISASNANNIAIRDCEFALFRQGIASSGSTGVVAVRCYVLSTDGNAAAIGIGTGASARVEYCSATGSASAGTAISVGADSHVTEPNVSGWANGIAGSGSGVRIRGGKVSASTSGVLLSGDNSCVDSVFVSSTPTGISLGGLYASAVGCTVSGSTSFGIQMTGSHGTASACKVVAIPASATGISITGTYGTANASTAQAASTTSTTGISLAATGASAIGCSAIGAATGISVGAVADSRLISNVCSSNTLDISIHASATNYSNTGNAYTTLTDSAGLWNAGLRAQRLPAAYSSQSNNTSSFTLTPSVGGSPINVNILVDAYAGGAGSMTVGNTATSNLQDGDLLFLKLVASTATTGNISVSWGTQYVRATGNNSGLGGATLTGATGDTLFLIFQWQSVSSKWCCVFNGKPHLVMG